MERSQSSRIGIDQEMQQSQQLQRTKGNQLSIVKVEIVQVVGAPKSIIIGKLMEQVNKV